MLNLEKKFFKILVDTGIAERIIYWDDDVEFNLYDKLCKNFDLIRPGLFLPATQSTIPVLMQKPMLLLGFAAN